MAAADESPYLESFEPARVHPRSAVEARRRLSDGWNGFLDSGPFDVKVHTASDGSSELWAVADSRADIMRELQTQARTTKPRREIASHQGFSVDLVYLCSTYSETGVTTAAMRRILRDSADARTPGETTATRRKWTRLSDEARVAVVERYEAGETSTALAEAYGVAKSTILGILRANSVVVRRQPLTPEQVSEAAKLYESGLSLSQVAALLKMNQETMRVAIVANGAILRPPSGGS